MPSSAEVAIIGAGITGASIAYHLARLGCREVVVLEKEAIAAGATGICPGGFRQQFGTEVNCRLSRLSYHFWQRANDELEPEHPLRFREGGYLFLAYSQRALEQFRRNLALQNRLGVPSRLLGPGEIGELVPQLNLSGVLGASWCPEDGNAHDPHAICMAFAAAARRLGVRFVFEEAVAIERANGRVTGVRTTGGAIATGAVVNCAGTDSARVAALAGIELPVVAEAKRLAFTRPVAERLLEPVVIALERGFGTKQMHDGTFMMAYLGPVDEGAEGARRFLEQTAEPGTDIFPPLGDLQVLRQLVGYYDSTPDYQAVLGGVDDLAGYYQACGFSGHGFSLAPAVGLVLAQLILGLEPAVPVEVLHHRRFGAGALLPEPSVI